MVEFKKRWLQDNKRMRVQRVIDEAIEDCRKELYKTYGIEQVQ